MNERFGAGNVQIGVNNGPDTGTCGGITGTSGVSGELSLEERMGCGFGACVGCSVMTAEGPKKVCSDGPVFEARVLF